MMQDYWHIFAEKPVFDDPFAPTPLAPWFVAEPAMEQRTFHEELAREPASTPSPLSKEPLKKPRRPLTAYNLFFQHERLRLIGPSHDKEGRKLPRRKVPFADMARIVSRRWKEADNATKAPFCLDANRDKIRYLEEKAEYKRELERRQQLCVAPHKTTEPQPQSRFQPLAPSSAPLVHSSMEAPRETVHEASLSNLAEDLDDETKELIIKIFG